MIKDYQITVTVKNNILLSVMKNNGFKNAAELSRATGVTQSVIGNYLNLKSVPINRKGTFNKSILDVSKVLRVLPEDLFPSQHLTKALNKNKVSVEMDSQAVENFLSNNSNPEELVGFIEKRKKIQLVLAKLPERTRKIIECRFGLNGEEMTLEECGNVFNISRERVRHIECRGLRQLRHPDRSTELKNL